MLKKSRSKINYYFRKYFIIPLKIFRKSLIDTIRHDGIEHAGYLAFLSILSFFPSLIFLIAVIGLFGESKIGTDFLHELVSSLPSEMSRGLTPRINEIISGPSDGYLTIAIIGVIWTASSSVEGCRTILNRAYRVAFPPPYILRRLVSIFEFFIIIIVIISGILVFVIVPLILKYFEKQFSLSLKIDYDFFYLRQLAIFVILTISTSVLYYALPNAKQKISQTIPGSILAVILWVTLVDFFSLYLENFDQMNFVYGSIAGIIISLMFFYLISLVFIFGAEFNYNFHRVYQFFLKKPNTKIKL
jgi:membrane protein